MMKLPNAITSTFGRQVLLAKKHSPVMMFSAGIAGAVTATVFACKATLSLEEVMEKHEENRVRAEQLRVDLPKEYTQAKYDRDVKLIRVQIARDVVKLYAPALAIGGVSIALLTGAHVTLTKRNAALGAAYAALDKGFREYRDRVRAELGENKDREFAFGSVEKEIVVEGEHGHEVVTVKRAGGPHSPYARVFDEHNQCWVNSAINNRTFLTSQQNYLNDLLQARGHVMLNDAYDVLKMERSQAGSVVGWVKGNKDDMIDFGLYATNDPVMRDFMNLDHNDGVVIDFNVDGVVTDLIGKKY